MIGDTAEILFVVDSEGLSAAQATMILEMYELLGLNSVKPLVVTTTSRRVGSSIIQTISDIGGVVTVTRT